jgi:hypothetical protein
MKNLEMLQKASNEDTPKERDICDNAIIYCLDDELNQSDNKQ